MRLKTSISAIIPYFNQGAYLEETLRSLADQNLPLTEILVVDDGSTDEKSKQVLNKVSTGKNVQVIRTINRGPGAARNTGFQNSCGDYILLIDSDDSIAPAFLEKAAAILEEYPKIGAVSSWALCFGHEDYIWYPQGGSVKDFMNFTTCPSCALVRRAAWIDADGFDETFLTAYEDWDFWIRVTKRNWIVYIIPELLYHYLQKDNSRVKESFRMHRDLHEKIKRSHPDVFF